MKIAEIFKFNLDETFIDFSVEKGLLDQYKVFKINGQIYSNF